MATTTASDFVIWSKHIYGDPDLVRQIGAMSPGQTLGLRVDGRDGVWVRLADGEDGRPTLGLKPLGRTRVDWQVLYKNRKGDAVSLKRIRAVERYEVSETSTRPFERQTAAARLPRSDVDRRVAVAALLDGAAQGWRSNGEAFSREDLHER